MTNTLTIEPRTAQEVWALARLVRTKKRAAFMRHVHLSKPQPKPIAPITYIYSHYITGHYFIVDNIPEAEILVAAVRVLQLSLAELKSKNRDHFTVQRRHALVYVLKKHGGLTNSHIGRLLDRDHSTILHSVRLVEKHLIRFNGFIQAILGKLQK